MEGQSTRFASSFLPLGKLDENGQVPRAWPESKHRSSEGRQGLSKAQTSPWLCVCAQLKQLMTESSRESGNVNELPCQDPLGLWDKAAPCQGTSWSI